MGTQITLKQQLPLQTSPTDSSISGILEPGEKAVITLTDDEEWLKIESTSGAKGWISLEGYSTISGIGKKTTDVFSGLGFAD